MISPLDKNISIFAKLLAYTTILIVFIGCASSIASHSVHNELTTKGINKVLLLPTDIRIYEIVANNIRDPFPKLTIQANQTVTNATKEYLSTTLGLQTDYYYRSNLNNTLREHMALINQVMVSIFKHTNPNSWDVWPHKKQQFDYNIGTGLAFLKNENIDAILMMAGAQNIQAFRDDRVFGNLNLFVCLVDITSGNVLWMDSSTHSGLDFRNPDMTLQMLSDAFNSFPRQILALSNQSEKQ